nr:hypothetical protein QOL21_08095 [Acholeplasma laidlawii]
MAYKNSIRLKKIAHDLNLKIVAGFDGEDRRVEVEMLSRPGVEFAGFLDFLIHNVFYLSVQKKHTF